MILQKSNGNRTNNSSSFHSFKKSNHFYEKLDGWRLPYTHEDELFYDLYNRVDEMKTLSGDDKELKNYPLLKKKHKNYPNTNYLIWESLNLCLVIGRGGMIITILNLYYNLDWDRKNVGGILV